MVLSLSSTRIGMLIATPILVAIAFSGAQYREFRQEILSLPPQALEIVSTSGAFAALFDGADALRPRLDIQLVTVAEGFNQVTDLQFVPGSDTELVVLEKAGRASLVDLAAHHRNLLLEIAVPTQSEQGLLGLAFHPQFRQNGRFFLNYSINKEKKDFSRVAEWRASSPSDLRNASFQEARVVMDVEQPYANHNAGQLAFGSDGMLYIGWGDGGKGGDPHNHGQDKKSFLGNMLRIDVGSSDSEKPYSIPSDNPYVGNAEYSPETFAYGLRNPWRYSFDPQGRLIVADVGQGAFEEIHIVPAGANLGWNIREGRHCFPPGKTCSADGMIEPIYEYSHDEGVSITGGYVYGGPSIPELKGRYVFGDFGSGRLWAIELPESASTPESIAIALGRWPIMVSTFGRNASGELFLADFQTGKIFRLGSRFRK